LEKVNPKLGAACSVVGKLQDEYHNGFPPWERKKAIAAQLHGFRERLVAADIYQWITPDCPACAEHCNHTQSTNRGETTIRGGSRHAVSDKQLAIALGCSLGIQGQQIRLPEVVNGVFARAVDELAKLEDEYHNRKPESGRTEEIATQLLNFKQHLFAADLYAWILTSCGDCAEDCDHEEGPKPVNARPRVRRTSAGN
jgi:hypothetical protein